MKIKILEIEEELSKYVLFEGIAKLENPIKPEASKTKFDLDPQDLFLEGALEISEEKKRQKRSSKLRNEAINKYGCKCFVCSFDFYEKYGRYGAGFIEVHHLRLLADIKAEQESTVEDVRVVCSNCHSVLHHQGREPMDINELRNFIKSKKNSK